MCFSASASFTASGLLAVISLASLVKAKNNNWYPFAAIPLLFAAQQTIEGLIWLSFSHESLVHAQTGLAQMYIFFAFFLWPVWIPFSLHLIEQNPPNKKNLFYLMVFGLVFGTLLLSYCLWSGIQVQVVDHHIYYDIYVKMPWVMLATIAYLVATVIPFFLVNKPYIWQIGSLLGISYIASYLFFKATLTSVWCFFGALISVFILFVV